MGLPSKAGTKLTLSSPLPSGTGTSRIPAHVRHQIGETNQLLRLGNPAFTTPGQRTTKGTRCPPSHKSALEPLRFALGKCPFFSRAPIFAALEHPFVTRKNHQSILAETIAVQSFQNLPESTIRLHHENPHNLPAHFFPRHSFVGTIGVCGEPNGTYKKKGCSLSAFARRSIYAHRLLGNSWQHV